MAAANSGNRKKEIMESDHWHNYKFSGFKGYYFDKKEAEEKGEEIREPKQQGEEPPIEYEKDI